MTDAEYSEYLKAYGDDCHCNECAIETLEDAGWLPADFAQYAPDLASCKQKKIVSVLFRLKHAYRKLNKVERLLRQNIRHAEREIKLNKDNPFFQHRGELLIERISFYSNWLESCKPAKISYQNRIFELIQVFDEYGKATPHEYAAILSTSHVHVEKALAMDDVTGLMHLIIYHVEDGANAGDFVSTGCVLHEAVSEVMIREIMQNKELRESAHGFLNDWFVESTGRPLTIYTVTTQPNGEPLLKRVPPRLAVVEQVKPVEVRNAR
ncbi:hypothetical protein [Methylomonas methanica]|nr:hypothetical protein [Methylomonas methanica]